MMFERLALVRTSYVRLVAVTRDVKDLIVVRLAALERGLGQHKLVAYRAHVAVLTLELGQLEGETEIRDRIVVFFVVHPDVRPRA